MFARQKTILTFLTAPVVFFVGLGFLFTSFAPLIASAATPREAREQTIEAYRGVEPTKGPGDSSEFAELLMEPIAFLTEVIFTATTKILSLGAFLLDYSIAVSLDSELLNNLHSINVGWTVVRDVANMFFIFILLYIAIGTVLQLSGVQWKRALANVIIVALLINFSLFFTKVIIDVSNVLAVTFYNSIQTQITTSSGTEIYHGPSMALMQGLKLQSVVDTTNYETAGADMEPSAFTRALVWSGGSIVNIIAAFTMVFGAILFVLRTISFIFLMVLSPLAFIGMILNVTRSYARDWWNTLWRNAFVAPVFLFMYFLIITIIREGDLANLTGSGSSGMGMALAGSGDNFAILFNFVLLIGLITSATTVAATVSSSLANKANSLAKKGIAMAAGGAIVGGAWAARRGYNLGYGNRGYRDNARQKMQDLADKDGIRGFVGRRAMQLDSKLERSSFDPRQTAIGGAVVGSLGKEANMGKNLGKGGRAALAEKRAGNAAAIAAAMQTTNADGTPRQRTTTLNKDGVALAEGVTETVSVKEAEARRQLAKAQKAGGANASQYRSAAQKIRRGDGDAKKAEKEAREAVAKERIDNANNILSGETVTSQQVSDMFDDMSARDIARLKPDVLERPEVAGQLGRQELAAMAQNKDLNLTRAQRRNIVREATNGVNGNDVVEWLNNSPAGQTFS